MHLPPPAATITSHPQNSLVHSRLLLVSGTVGTPASASHINGHIVVHFHTNNFPPQTFPVAEGRFKALLHLTPGPNTVQILFGDQPDPAHRYIFNVTYHPLFQNPPLHLLIIVGKDSPERYDDVPGCAEAPSLQAAIKKFRMAAYLWQAYTGTQMHEHGLGHRTFRLFETWEPETVTCRDPQPRATAKVHVIRSRYTMEEIRHPNRAQQNHKATDKDWLYNVAMKTVQYSPQIFGTAQARGRLHVAAMFLDSTIQKGFVAGHAALGGAGEDIALGIFGSHTLFSWPSCIENVVPAFADTRPVNTRHCAVDGEGKIYGMAANVGIGAMMHEVGHAFGCPHQPYGVMARCYPRLNKAFSVLPLPGSSGHDCIWHRLDALRFLTHPCFALPSDPAPSREKGTFQITGDSSGITITSSSGLLFIEFRLGTSEVACSFLDLVNQQPQQYTITRAYLTASVSRDIKVIKFSVFAIDGSSHEHISVSTYISALLPAGVCRTQKFGTATGSPAVHVRVPRGIKKLKIYYHNVFDGIEFFPSSGASVLFGKRQGSVKEIKLKDGETVRGFEIRSGWWIDAVKVKTNREVYGWFGDHTKGSPGEVVMPDGMRICGVWGSVGGWIDGFGLEYCPEDMEV